MYSRLNKEEELLQTVPYPASWQVGYRWRNGFSFPEGFKNNVRQRFPDWVELNFKLDTGDWGVWDLLWLYQRKLAEIKPEEIVEAENMGALKYIVARAKQALEVSNWINNLEKEFFPEEIVRREERARLAAESWEY